MREEPFDLDANNDIHKCSATDSSVSQKSVDRNKNGTKQLKRSSSSRRSLFPCVVSDRSELK